MKLNNTQVAGLKPASKRYKMSDGGGLYLEVTPNGSKLWRFRYRFNGKQKLLAIGKYPEVTLKKAREQHAEAKRKLADGIDPSEQKKQEKEIQSHTLKNVALEWWKANRETWSEGHANIIWRRLELNVLPWLGDYSIIELSTRMILQTLRRIESRGAVETAHRVGGIISQVYVYAIACGIADNNPANGISKALKVVPKKSFPSITEPKQIKELLNAIDSLQAHFVVCCSLKFLPLVFVRPGELRNAEWQEIDFESNLWTIPGYKMKRKRDHLVPLARQAVSILNDLYPLTNSSHFIFPSVRTFSKPLSENTINAALRRLGYSQDEMCAHGFRTMASTRLHELGWDTRIVEIQLAHKDQNKVRSVYNKAEHLEERFRMMQAWADYLDNLKY